MSSTNYYKVLGISKEATQAEIRSAYRTKALDVHPDKNEGKEDAFLLLKNAYDTLSDIQKRAAYDRSLNTGKPKLPRVPGFKRPPPLAEVTAPVSLTLPDGKPYTFETAPSVVRGGVSYGDMLGYEGDTGSFVGLAGDHCWWWCKGGQEYPTKLCDPSSDMNRSAIKVLARGKHTTRTASSKPMVRVPPAGKPGMDAAAMKERALKEKRAELEKMRQAILREGQQRVRASAMENLINEEKRLRVSRQNFFIEKLYLVHSTYSSLLVRLLALAAPTPGEWEEMFEDAQKPLPPFYPEEDLPSAAPTAVRAPEKHADPISSKGTTPSTKASTTKPPAAPSPKESTSKSRGLSSRAAASSSRKTAAGPAAATRVKASGSAAASPKEWNDDDNEDDDRTVSSSTKRRLPSTTTGKKK